MSRIPSPAEELSNSKVDPDARAIWEEALRQPEFADVSVIWCYSASTSSDHRNGRCADFMVTHTDRPMSPGQRQAMGSAIVRYFIRNAVRLNVQGIIFDHHVYGFPGTRELGTGSEPHPTYRGPAGVARPYSGPNPHEDHVHVQVSGAPMRSRLNNEGEDMPTPEELWNWDHVPAPDYRGDRDKNPTWKPSSVLVEAAQEAHEASVKADALLDKVNSLGVRLDKLIASLAPKSETAPPKKS